MTRRLLLLLIAVVYTLAPVGLRAQDDMDTIGGDATIPAVTIAAPQISITPAPGPLELGTPFTLTLKPLIEGDFESISFTLEGDQKDALATGAVIPAADGTFTMEARARRSGGQVLKPRIVAKPRGSDNPMELVAADLLLDIQKPAFEMSETLREVGNPRDIPFNYLWRNIILTVAGVLFVAALTLAIWLLLRWQKAKAQARAEAREVVPVIDLVTARLNELAALSVFREKGPDAHYTELSQAMRWYLEHHFGRPFLEMTEDEVVRVLRNELAMLPEADKLPDVFLRSSMAKFARQELDETMASQDCRTALTFLDRERSRLEAEARARAARAAAAAAGGNR